MAEPGSGRSDKGLSRKALVWVGGVIGIAVTAFFVTIATNTADRVSTPKPPPAQLISYSSEEVKSECTFDTYLPLASARAVLKRDPPADWTEIQRRPGAVFIDREIVRVSVQGESARVITLTKPTFHVTSKKLAYGERFSDGCGGPFTGRAMEVDLDQHPPRMGVSSRDADGVLGETGENGQRTARPIRFPWTVSITDPLLLYIFAGTAACYCEWTAEIPWFSGARHGVIRIDDHGKPYKVVTGTALANHTVVAGRWALTGGPAPPLR